MIGLSDVGTVLVLVAGGVGTALLLVTSLVLVATVYLDSRRP